MGLVGGERDRQVVLGLELVLLGHRIGGHAENRGAGPGEGGASLEKSLASMVQPGGVGLGIEIEHELAALEVGERHLAAAVAGQG